MAQSITTPDGVITSLQVLGGKLETVTDAETNAHGLGYDAKGLLTSRTDPRGILHEFHYDADDRLFLDEQGGGGSKSLDRSETEDGYEVTVTTGGDIVNVYSTQQIEDGVVETRRTRPSAAPPSSATTPSPGWPP